jgi:hypothetical protein
MLAASRSVGEGEHVDGRLHRVEARWPGPMNRPVCMVRRRRWICIRRPNTVGSAYWSGAASGATVSSFSEQLRPGQGPLRGAAPEVAGRAGS